MTRRIGRRRRAATYLFLMMNTVADGKVADGEVEVEVEGGKDEGDNKNEELSSSNGNRLCGWDTRKPAHLHANKEV